MWYKLNNKTGKYECHCPGECPENCLNCIYLYCTKEVDFKLTEYNYYNNENFEKWFKEYFRK